MAKKVTKKKSPTKKKASTKKTTAKKTATEKTARAASQKRAKAAAKASVVHKTVTVDEIRARAFEIYCSGRNPSNPDADWLQAEQELNARATS